MHAFYMCFTCVLRRARFAIFFDRAKDIVKSVLRQPGPRKSFGLAGVLAREPQPNAAFLGPEAPAHRRNRVILSGSWTETILNRSRRKSEASETRAVFLV